MGTGVSAPEAFVLISARNDLFCYNRIGWRRGCVSGLSVVCQWFVSGLSGVCLWHEFTFQHSKSAMQCDEIKHPPSSNFRGRTVGLICQDFSWTDVPRMRLQLKILFGIKTLPILKKSGKTCSGGRSMLPHPHWRVKPITCNRL